MRIRTFLQTSLVAAAASLAACSSADSPASPEADFRRIALSTTTGTAGTGQPWGPDVVTLCKVAPVGTYATFEITASEGTLLMGSTPRIDVAAGASSSFDADNNIRCEAVWQATSTTPATVTIRETGATPGLTLQKITTMDGLSNWAIYTPPAMSASVENAAGSVFWFKNFGTPTTDGSQGCTPGYWKQAHHFDSWPSAYTPGMLFSAAGFTNVFPGMTLLQVLRQGGGGLNALGRHAVAALLSGGNPEVDYGMSSASVVAAFNAAVANGTTGALHVRLEEMNERGCPLD